MGWTHDHGDSARNRRSAATPGGYERSGRSPHGDDHRLDIPRILRRRARWVSARLRHPRS
ncbi:hypothetical protein [Streptomyces sp. NPDC097619]|uniref:hypothetical protein n=1 Tax=Streptomyces sp. NPDC097619 TaxID=3157228 RepID=UPI0033204C8F